MKMHLAPFCLSCFAVFQSNHFRDYHLAREHGEGPYNEIYQFCIRNHNSERTSNSRTIRDARRGYTRERSTSDTPQILSIQLDKNNRQDNTNLQASFESKLENLNAMMENEVYSDLHLQNVSNIHSSVDTVYTRDGLNNINENSNNNQSYERVNYIEANLTADNWNDVASENSSIVHLEVNKAVLATAKHNNGTSINNVNENSNDKPDISVDAGESGNLSLRQESLPKECSAEDTVVNIASVGTLSVIENNMKEDSNNNQSDEAENAEQNESTDSLSQAQESPPNEQAKELHTVELNQLFVNSISSTCESDVSQTPLNNNSVINECVNFSETNENTDDIISLTEKSLSNMNVVSSVEWIVNDLKKLFVNTMPAICKSEISLNCNDYKTCTELSYSSKANLNPNDDITLQSCSTEQLRVNRMIQCEDLEQLFTNTSDYDNSQNDNSNLCEYQYEESTNYNETNESTDDIISLGTQGTLPNEQLEENNEIQSKDFEEFFLKTTSTISVGQDISETNCVMDSNQTNHATDGGEGTTDLNTKQKNRQNMQLEEQTSANDLNIEECKPNGQFDSEDSYLKLLEKLYPPLRPLRSNSKVVGNNEIVAVNNNIKKETTEKIKTNRKRNVSEKGKSKSPFAPTPRKRPRLFNQRKRNVVRAKKETNSSKNATVEPTNLIAAAAADVVTNSPMDIQGNNINSNNAEEGSQNNQVTRNVNNIASSDICLKPTSSRNKTRRSFQSQCFETREITSKYGRCRKVKVLSSLEKY